MLAGKLRQSKRQALLARAAPLTPPGQRDASEEERTAGGRQRRGLAEEWWTFGARSWPGVVGEQSARDFLEGPVRPVEPPSRRP